MKNPADYGKARGVMLLKKYLPEVAPFTTMAIISSAEEWQANKNRFGKFVVQRVDFPVGTSAKCSFAGTSGYADDLPRALEKVQAENPDGVILVMDTDKPTVPRYVYDGAFNVIFSVGNNAIIEFVGRGFDGRELTQGLAVHEHFEVPWGELSFIKNRSDLIRNSVTTYTHVCADEYARQRKARVDFLIQQCNYDEDKVEMVPNEFRPIPDYLIEEFISGIVARVMERVPWMMREDGLNLFGIQGNFVLGKVQPFEIFRPKRW